MNIHVRFLGAQRSEHLSLGGWAGRAGQEIQRQRRQRCHPATENRIRQAASSFQVNVRDDIDRSPGNASYYDGWRYVNHERCAITQIMEL